MGVFELVLFFHFFLAFLVSQGWNQGGQFSPSSPSSVGQLLHPGGFGGGAVPHFSSLVFPTGWQFHHDWGGGGTVLPHGIVWGQLLHHDCIGGEVVKYFSRFVLSLGWQLHHQGGFGGGAVPPPM